jgi:tungstate transport system permease protein
MNDFGAAFTTAFELMTALDPDLVQIVLLSLRVSTQAVLVAAVIGLPLGALLAIYRFPGRTPALVLLNALMGLPPVVAGLVIYLLLSRAGPLGELGLLFTPRAMIVAQAVLVTPIVAALTRQAVAETDAVYREQLASFGLRRPAMIPTLLWESRHAILVALLAGFGRAIAEVGAVFIVGGNIDGVTRVMTTAIALETARGDLELALGLGMILVTLAVLVNAAAMALRALSARGQG